MRVSNDRYSRDLRSIDLAHRMLGHEARTQTIRAWTGLSGERVRNLCRSHGGGRGRDETIRHRGPSPSKLSALLSTALMRSEAAAAAGLCRVLGVIPAERWAHPQKTLPSLARGERLCYAFELYRQVVPQARLTLEQLVLLVLTVADGESWMVDYCTTCHATILIDRLSPSRRLCARCEPLAGAKPTGAAAQEAVNDPSEPNTDETAYEQQSLF